MLSELDKVIASQLAPGAIFEIKEADVLGQTMKVWANAPATLRDAWLTTAAYAERDYIVYQDERWTYQQAHEEISRIANWLVSQGIQKNDRIAIAMRNYPEWMLCYWAISSIGAVTVGVNAWWVADELTYALKDSTPKMIICDRERLERFSEIRQDHPDIAAVAVRVEEIPDWATPWSEVLKSEAVLPDVTIAPDDDVCIFYTSGTTGFPKGAQLTHRSCTNQLLSTLFANITQMTAQANIEGKEPINFFDPSTPQMTGIVITPLFHVTAVNGMAHGLTALGGKIVLMYKWEAGEALRLIDHEKVTNFTGVPTMSRELINHPDFSKRDLSSLISMAGGGAAVQPDLIDKINASGVNAQPAQAYGLTETSGMATASTGIFLTNKPNSVGRAAPVLDIKCIDENGSDLPTGETGEICIRGPHIVKGYLNRPDATAETIVDGWLLTGDIGFIDDDDFVYLVDRAKDMVLRGGENVYCTEVEVALYKFPNIAECAVFSVADERLGEEVGAALFAKPDTTIDVNQLRAFLKTKLAAYKIPRYIWVTDTQLPVNASGKFVKRDLQLSLNIEDAS
jgi:long-chain acyl-CoA synthetase